ncbi:unnamed protein product [Rodentolepis nana]|uniref:Rhodanese domain-containing protein n=1 Tax=Rodentolepis nana TaxID=102285 RepID=A0A0R3TTA0_RODNA|nr:unnamed protein product [Rodentolepis nana]
MSRAKKNPKDDKQYEKVEHKTMAVTASAVGDPNVVNCLIYNSYMDSHRTTKYTYDISVTDGNAGRGGAVADLILAVYDVGDYRTVDYLRQYTLPSLGRLDNLVILGIRAECRLYRDSFAAPYGTLRSLMQQGRCPGTEIFHCGGPQAASAIFALYGRVNPEPFENDKNKKKK